MRILVVDDDNMFFQLLQDVLQGDTLIQARTSREAQKLLTTTTFGCMLVDGILDHGDEGPTLIESLLQHPPVVAITGSDEMANRFRAMGVRTIMKPFNVPELSDAILETVGVSCSV